MLTAQRLMDMHCAPGANLMKKEKRKPKTPSHTISSVVILRNMYYYFGKQSCSC